jgi:ABC-type polar amino acid transport system ATPase subunit
MEDVAAADRQASEEVISSDPQQQSGQRTVNMSQQSPVGDGAPLLSLRHIHKRFHAGTKKEAVILKDVSLDIPRAKVTVLLGPSGSGKSTLLRCMNLIAPFDEGEMTFMGKTWLPEKPGANPLKRWKYEQRLVELRSHIGMVFQQFNLYPTKTALENVALGLRLVKKLPRSDAERLALAELQRVGLAEKATYYPSQLSGGQKQRVAIARALAMKPDLMLFDEATSALDPELRGGILEEMKKLASEGMTMVVVTHEISFAREVGDRVVFMDHGQIVEQGDAKTVIDNPQNPRTRTFLGSILSQT